MYLHGAGGSGNLVKFAEALAETFNVILPDHPGFGESELPPWLDNIHDAAYFYLDLLKALNLRDVHVVGSSLGGWIALEIAVRSTARINSLILSGAAGLNLKGTRRGDIFMWEPPQRIRNMIVDQALAEKILSVTPTEEQAAIAVKNEFATARLAWEPRFFDPNLHKWLHRIDVPTQIVWGDGDKVFPLPFGENLQRHIPGSVLTVIPKCGHLPHVEQPDRFKTIITGFIASTARQGAAA
ncbi:MAG: alpha/beta hydrolase [Rhodospirillaceae bacterium]|nr:alpha/beta hydrolase [Rhodospirillaceae bacterium]